MIKRLLPLILLAPLCVGFAPRDSADISVELWGASGRFYQPGSCEHRGRDVKYFEGAAVVEYRYKDEKICLDDSGRTVVQKVPTPFSVRLDCSLLQGEGTELIEEGDTYSYYSPRTVDVTMSNLGAKLQWDWANFGLGLGGMVLDDGEDAGLAPSVRVRIGPRDELYLSGELLYACPLRSGQGLLNAGLGFRTGTMDAWVGGGYGPYDHALRPCITIRQNIRDMMVGINLSYGSEADHGITPYAVSLGVGYQF